MLEIVRTHEGVEDSTYANALSNLAVAEAILWKAGKKTAESHFIAVVKELERVCGFEFQELQDGSQDRVPPDSTPGG